MYYKHIILSREEELEYFKRYHGGDINAYHTLIESQIGWSNKLAIEFCKQISWCDLDAAMSAGYLGVIHAIRKFDVTRGSRLTTYSKYWIDQYLRRVSKQERELISIPEYLGLKDKKEHPNQRFAKVRLEGAEKLKDFPAINSISEHEKYIDLLVDVEDSIKRLSKREQFVIQSIFYDRKILKVIGKELGVSRQRVQQIKEESLGKIRRYLKKQGLFK